MFLSPTTMIFLTLSREFQHKRWIKEEGRQGRWKIFLRFPVLSFLVFNYAGQVTPWKLITAPKVGLLCAKSFMFMISDTPYNIWGRCSYPILQIRRMRLRNSKDLGQGHRAYKQLSQDVFLLLALSYSFIMDWLMIHHGLINDMVGWMTDWFNNCLLLPTAGQALGGQRLAMVSMGTKFMSGSNHKQINKWLHSSVTKAITTENGQSDRETHKGSRGGSFEGSRTIRKGLPGKGCLGCVGYYLGYIGLGRGRSKVEAGQYLTWGVDRQS